MDSTHIARTDALDAALDTLDAARAYLAITEPDDAILMDASDLLFSAIQRVERARVIAAGLDRPTHYTYHLPDGTQIRLAADLCKGASIITYELKAVPPARRGRIVDAVIVREG